MKRDDELTVAVEDFALDGKCVARVDGFVVFVHDAIPGDSARVRIVRAKKSYAEAEVVELLSLSPLRVVPRCVYAGSCGGCRCIEKSRALGKQAETPADRISPKKMFRVLRSRPSLTYVGPGLYPLREGQTCVAISVAEEGGAPVCVEFQDGFRGICEPEELR